MAREAAAKFRCPTCGYMTASRVVETRGARRRRRCSECGDTYPTIETLAPRGRRPKRYPPSRQTDLDFELT